jgi:hypothetical protein
MPSYKTYCVTHAPAQLPPALVDFTIGLGQHNPISGASIAELDSYWHERRPVAYGAAGSYAIPRAIDEYQDRSDLIGICTHRKIVIRDSIGRESTLAPPMREAEIGEVSALTREACQPREPHEFLLPMPIGIGNVVANYNDCHNVVDLLDYLSIAVEIGTLARGEVARFVTQNTLVTGGCELGVYPRQWLIETLEKLERVGRVFVERHAERIKTYDDYNIRALAFLSERLGSFLLISELVQRYPGGVPRDLFGFICCVVDPGSSYTTARAAPEPGHRSLAER